MLMMLEEGVHWNLQCGQIPEDTPLNAFPGMSADRQPARTFRDLAVWRKAHEFVLNVYSFTAGFPRQETYGLALQMRRAAVSIPANIAEGFRRRGKADKARFMNVAEGSIEECRYFLILASDLGYGDTSSLSALLDEVSRMLNAYASAILASNF
jgi:four helix bundle protein